MKRSITVTLILFVLSTLAFASDPWPRLGMPVWHNSAEIINAFTADDGNIHVFYIRNHYLNGERNGKQTIAYTSTQEVYKMVFSSKTDRILSDKKVDIRSRHFMFRLEGYRTTATREHLYLNYFNVTSTNSMSYPETSYDYNLLTNKTIKGKKFYQQIPGNGEWHIEKYLNAAEDYSYTAMRSDSPAGTFGPISRRDRLNDRINILSYQPQTQKLTYSYLSYGKQMQDSTISRYIMIPRKYDIFEISPNEASPGREIFSCIATDQLAIRALPATDSIRYFLIQAWEKDFYLFHDSRIVSSFTFADNGYHQRQHAVRVDKRIYIFNPSGFGNRNDTTPWIACWDFAGNTLTTLYTTKHKGGRDVEPILLNNRRKAIPAKPFPYLDRRVRFIPFRSK